MVSPFLPDDEKVAAIREALPATAAGIYLNTGTAGPLPREVARAMAELEGWELRTGRAHQAFIEESLDRMAEARAAVAAVIGTDPSRIALTHSTGDGMSAATWAVDWRPGDRAVTTSLEHPAALGSLWALRERFGVEVVVADVGSGGRDEVLAALDRALTPGTRLVSVSHVSWATGALLPVGEIGTMAHDRGALAVVDGAQSAGAVPVSVEDLGVDFYSVPGQKWLLGPEGSGALYCAPAMLDRPRMAFASWASFEAMDLWLDGRPWPDARRFESSGFHKPSVVGMARSCAWLAMYVGLPWIYDRTARLAASARDLMAEIPGVEVLTPRSSMAGLVTFRIGGWAAEAALDELQARTFAIARTVPGLDAIRLSVAFFNTEAEIARVRDGVALLAEHTPDTLPRKPRITVIQGGA